MDKQRAHMARIQAIQERHERRMRELDREGARLACWICSPVAVGWLIVAWLDFSRGDIPASLLMVAGALAFIVLMVVALMRTRRK